MSSFDWFFTPSSSAAASIDPSSTTSTSSMPDWYNQYTQGIAAKGLELAANSDNNPIPQQSVAGFTPDQTQAFQQVRDMQGAWKPGMASATGATQGALTTATNAAGAANSAVAGPAQTFTGSNVQSYMSPYTGAVVDEIARLGNKNFNDKIMPGVQLGALGAGQFGSTRNADVLGQAAADAQAAITGQQASALESGYATAGNLFNQDANRTQQQQQMQASTALQGGQLAAGTGLSGGQQLGALTQSSQALGLGDAQALQAVGQQQQQLQQTGLDTAYNNQVGQNNYGWSNLDNLNSIIRGVQLPTSQTSTNTGALTRTYGASPLTQLGGTYAAAAGS